MKTPVLTQRAVAHIDKDMHMVGRVGRFQIESDEPPERGGDDLAPAARAATAVASASASSAFALSSAT